MLLGILGIMIKVLLCGGGNAIHVLCSYVGSRSNPQQHDDAHEDCEVRILSIFPGEAARLSAALPESGICCHNDLGPEVYGKPVAISDDPAVVAPGAQVVILAIPSFTHELYLKALRPYLQPGVVIGAMPGEGGFDLCARSVLGDEFVCQSTLFALETLPWACRIIDYGKTVEVLGTKKEIDVVITPKSGETIDQTLDLLQKLIGTLPKLMPACNFLVISSVERFVPLQEFCLLQTDLTLLFICRALGGDVDEH